MCSVIVKACFVFDLDKTERSARLADMPRDGTATRERILDVATDIAMDRGFAAASLDEVLGQSGVTKGAFYHYFDSKADLGRAILERYATADLETLDRLWVQAEQLSRDPLQQLLLFVGLFANLDELATDDPGCLYATFIYERQLGVDGAIDVIDASVQAWRDRFRAKLDEVVSATRLASTWISTRCRTSCSAPPRAPTSWPARRATRTSSAASSSRFAPTSSCCSPRIGPAVRGTRFRSSDRRRRG